MYYHFLGGITTQTNFDLILSFDDECFQIIILFLVSAQYVYPVYAKTELIYRELSWLTTGLTAETSNTYLLHT